MVNEMTPLARYLANKARRRAHAEKVAARKVYRKRQRRRELWRYADD